MAIPSVLNTLEDALLKRTYKQGELILHSDLGSEYTFQEYEEALKDAGVLHSFSKKAVLMIMPEWSPSMPASRRSVFIDAGVEVLKKHKRMFLIIYIVFIIGNKSTVPARFLHQFKWKKLHNRLLNAYSSHFFGQKSRVNYFRASINGQAFFSLRVDGNSGTLPEWTFSKKLSKKCVSDIDFIPIRYIYDTQTMHLIKFVKISVAIPLYSIIVTNGYMTAFYKFLNGGKYE